MIGLAPVAGIGRACTPLAPRVALHSPFRPAYDLAYEQQICWKISIHYEAYALVGSRKTLSELAVSPIESRQNPM